MRLSMLFFVLFFLGSCSKKQDPSARELHLISYEKIAGYDPINTSDVYSSAEAGKIYEGLYEFHPLKRPYVLVPNLAESMPEVSGDGLSYIIRLRKDVFFQDDEAFPNGEGRKMTAEDVIYSIKRLADPKLSAKGWWVLDEKIAGLNEWRKKNEKSVATDYGAEVTGLKKLDDFTLQFGLTKPFPQFLYSLAMSFTYVVPHEAVERYQKEFLNHPVGTGPYVLKKFEQNNHIVYVKNPKFREKFYPNEGEDGDKEKGFLDDAGKRLPLVEKVIVDVVIESQPGWFLFQKGKADLLVLPKDNFQAVLDEKLELKSSARDRGVRLTANPVLSVSFVAFNNEHRLLKNKKLRAAMSLAYDRVAANRIFYNGTSMIANGIIPPGLAGYQLNYRNPYLQHDLEKARKLLSEAGYPGGKGLPELRVEIRADTIERQMMEHFAKCMSDIGVKVVASTNTWPELSKKVTTKQAQMYFMSWSADYPDAENFLQLLYCPNSSPGSNGSNYCNPEFDRLFREASVMQDSPERTAKYEALNRLGSEDVPWVLMFNRKRYHLMQGWLKNYKFTEFNHSQVQYLNVDMEKKKELLAKME